MRNSYFAQFQLDDSKIKSIWRTGLFAFDANTILNLYRYSDTTRREFIDVLKGLKGRVWLPEQAATEFFANRLSEISLQVKAYDSTKSTIDNLRDELNKNRGHPHISTGTMARLSSVLEDVQQELDQNRSAHLNRINSDDILDEVADLFEARTGKKYEQEDLEKIISIGTSRMTMRVPPGYKDYPKHKTPITEYERRANFGDFIVWMQTIDYAKSESKPIVLVTDDAKEDWWLIAHGRTVGPRPELTDEFFQATGQNFLMYKPEQFLRYAKDHLQSNVSKETLDEVKESAAREKVDWQKFRNLVMHSTENSTSPNVNISHFFKKVLNEDSRNNPHGISGDRLFDHTVRHHINRAEFSEALELANRELLQIRHEQAHARSALLKLEDEQKDSGGDDEINTRIRELSRNLKSALDRELKIITRISAIQLMLRNDLDEGSD